MLQITSSFPVGAFPDPAHTEPDYCWAPCDWWASQPETRRNFYFCFAFSNRDWRTNINKHKYFQKAAFSGLFPLIQRAASYYPVTEQTRTPTAICSEQLPATAMQHMLKTTAELEDINTEPRAAAPPSRWLWQPSRTPWPHSPAPPLLHPSLSLLSLQVDTVGIQPVLNPESGNNSFVYTHRTRLIWSMLTFETIREHKEGHRRKTPRPWDENNCLQIHSIEIKKKKKIEKNSVLLFSLPS